MLNCVQMCVFSVELDLMQLTSGLISRNISLWLYMTSLGQNGCAPFSFSFVQEEEVKVNYPSWPNFSFNHLELT